MTNNTIIKKTWTLIAIIGVFVAVCVYIFTSTNNKPRPSPTAFYDDASIDVSPPASRLEISVQPPTAQVPMQATGEVDDYQVPGRAAIGLNPSCDSPTKWSLAKDYEDQRIAVIGNVAEYAYLPDIKGGPTWINIGAKYPVRDRLSIVIWADDRDKFGRALSSNLVDSQICAIGTVKLQDGTPEITLESPRELVLM
ncbi:hypothetical protein [Halopseudomonas sp.]|jgi:hypothetical protein|uniref:hypothetical protein n=1 Tax=Halopseudomonas sp. TaxID=2901191 RepID=UPI0039E6E00F